MNAVSYKISKFVTVLEISRKEAKTAAGGRGVAVLHIGKNDYLQLSRNDEKCRKNIIGLSYRQSRIQMSMLTTLIYLVSSLVHEVLVCTGEFNCNQGQNSKIQRRKTGTSVDLSIDLDNNFR